MKKKQKSTFVRSSLKWAGSKHKILERVLHHLPKDGRLIEPFAGSAVVSLNSGHKKVILNDLNEDLVGLFAAIKEDCEGFIKLAKTYFEPRYNCEEEYYRLRELFNKTREPRLRAALFLYLNRHGYNGLARYNRSGMLNVPFGRYKRPYFPTKELLAMHQLMRRATVTCGNFVQAMRKARKGDVVYCDPPYIPLSKTSNFTSYNPGGFSSEQQVLLAKEATRAAKRGATVVVSNHDTPHARDVFAEADYIHRVSVRRTISGKSSGRRRVGEIIAVYVPMAREQKGGAR